MKSAKAKSIVLKSLMLRNEMLIPLELEVKAVPGLPKIEFLGLPETGLKESSHRIKAAIRSAGFEFPRGRTILVDVRPRAERKHGRGLDLPVALGLLAATGQIDFAKIKEFSIYGDLGLDGEVRAPSDWIRARSLVGGPLFTGAGPSANGYRGSVDGEGVWTIDTIAAYDRPTFIEPESAEDRDNASPLSDHSQSLAVDLFLETEQAKIAVIAAMGGHSVLFAGPQGTGKSTLARLIHHLSPPPTRQEQREIETWTGQRQRPLVDVHHTAGEIAMVGGRLPPRPGAITRAHRGTLLLDEVLQFRAEVQDALREPIENGFVTLARGSDERCFPSDFQLVGTTNLCACGMWTPGDSGRCRCVSRKRAEYESRLRGPFVDRFQMMIFSSEWIPSKGTVSLESMRQRVKAGIEFANSMGRIALNRRWPVQDVSAEVLSALPKSGSERRRLAILRIARTLADLEAYHSIRTDHVFEATRYCLDAFTLLSASDT